MNKLILFLNFRIAADQTFVGLEDVLKTCPEEVLKTCLEDVLKTCPEDVLKTCLEDVLKTCLEDLLKILWRQKNTYWGYLYSYLGITNLNVYLTSLYFTNLYLTILKRIQNALNRTQ